MTDTAIAAHSLRARTTASTTALLPTLRVVAVMAVMGKG